MTGVHIKRRNLDTDSHTQGESSGRCRSQGTPDIASQLPKLGERPGRDSPLTASGNNPADTLNSDSWTSEMWDDTFQSPSSQYFVMANLAN